MHKLLSLRRQLTPLSFVLVFSLACPAAWALQNVTLAWNASPDPQVVGSVVYWGTAKGVYPNRIDAGTNTTLTISGLQEGITYYFAATAYNAYLVESVFSNEVTYTPAVTNDLPSGTVQFKAAAYVVAEDAGSLRIHVSRTGGSSGAASVFFATANRTAAAGQDFVGVSGTLNWAGGDAQDKYFDVPIVNDSIAEGDEDFIATLSAASGAALGSPSTTIVTIPSNDTVQVSLKNGGFEEGYTGWTPTGNQVISARASEGVKAVQFNGGQTSPNGVLVQSFATRAGQSYRLTIDVGAVWGSPTTQQRLQVTLQGTTTLINETVIVYGTGNSSSKYESRSFDFAANSEKTALTFRDASPTSMNIDLLLDNVRVTTLPNQAPDSVITSPAADISITVGQTVSFAGSGTDKDNNLPLLYLWTFGTDLGLPNSTVQNPGSLQFNSPGVFTVTLTVTDALGLADPTPAKRIVTVQPAPAGLVNGGFETGYTGWTASGNQVISSRASEGVKAVQFNSGQTSPNGVLYQTFATSPGGSYTLAFDAGAVWGTPKTEQRLEVTLKGAATLLSQTVVVYGTGNSSSKYVAKSFNFVADSNITRLTFRDVSPTGLNVDLLLDNVRIIPQGGAASPTVSKTRLAAPVHARVLSIEPAANGLRIRMTVAKPGTYELQCSPDLISWKPVDNRAMENAGTCEFLVADRSNGMMFYRVLPSVKSYTKDR